MPRKPWGDSPSSDQKKHMTRAKYSLKSLYYKLSKYSLHRTIYASTQRPTMYLRTLVCTKIKAQVVLLHDLEQTHMTDQLKESH